ncbi:hypothetical protein AURANDRAFT_61714 [Aureococcus anophagefferens]|uniref:EF-hand domain-containing protein n=1 Tax=Aureococcus anophagefferens TaxID=44056 RepID=F0XZD4_AURAN|nr:hypothetical protein AURANDRAFT_61714 [Aureococcus anophagefferens]EGB11632.1 hypothetical protein AURANDRAFT_61714 [Aureococcus anophagefferens]|eukprot:XP_009033979.1 hypothetical protein AURANDRAFT_61714 [Aureococcus anophagefferens]
MSYTSDVDVELGSPAEIAVLSALNARLDAIDVAGCDAIFDLLDKHNRNVLSLEELREGVRSDAVEDYIRETGNVVMKGLLKDWERSEARVGRALAALDPELTGKVTREHWRKFVVSVARERVRHLRALGLLGGRCYWGRGLEDAARPTTACWWFCCGCLPRGYCADFWFYCRNAHPALFFLRDDAHPFSRLEALAAELVVQCFCACASIFASRHERPWTSLGAYAHNGLVTCVCISFPVLVLQELLFVLLACPCVRYERRGRKRELCFACWQRSLECVGHLVVLPLVVAAVGLVAYAAYLLHAHPEAQVHFLLWWAAGLAGSYALWFPVKLSVQFNLCFGSKRTAALAKFFALGRWAHERRTAALNALRFGDDDDDALEDLAEPWRIFES